MVKPVTQLYDPMSVNVSLRASLKEDSALVVSHCTTINHSKLETRSTRTTVSRVTVMNIQLAVYTTQLSIHSLMITTGKILVSRSKVACLNMTGPLNCTLYNGELCGTWSSSVNESLNTLNSVMLESVLCYFYVNLHSIGQF